MRTETPIRISMSWPEANAAPVLLPGEKPSAGVIYKHNAVATATNEMLTLNRHGFALSEIAHLLGMSSDEVQNAVSRLPGYLPEADCAERASMEGTWLLEQIVNGDKEVEEVAASLARRGMLF